MVSEDRPNDSKEYTLYFNQSHSQIAASRVIVGHFWEALTPAQVKKLLPNLAEKYAVEGIVNYSHEDGKTSIFGVNTSFMRNDNVVKITIAPNEVLKCYMIEGTPVLSEMEGIKIEAGIFTTDKNSRGERNYIYYANFKLEGVAYDVEYAGEENDTELFTSIIADIVLGGKADLSVVENPVLPELRDDKLTEKEAYAEADFGAYLPKIPNTYLLNSATRFINQASDYLFASWSRGYEDVRITISKLKEQDEERIVSVEDTALYDMSLYPIPWADSMPREKAPIIENPIFKMEDLTLAIVKMRGYIRGEQGDPSGNSINLRFSVLYDDILVEVAAEGLTTEALFDALSSLPRK